MQRVIRIVLRMAFYATPVIYAQIKVPSPWDRVLELNPMTGVLELQRAGFFAEPVQRSAVLVSVVASLLIFLLGAWTFTRLERSVLKEI
jgi:ABC-2 type transport system permease protein